MHGNVTVKSIKVKKISLKYRINLLQIDTPISITVNAEAKSVATNKISEQRKSLLEALVMPYLQDKNRTPI